MPLSEGALGTTAAVGARMTNDKATLTLRDRVLGQLSDDENSKVTNAETAASLTAGDEYLDLEHLAKGVLKAGASKLTMGNALPKSAVQPKTWATILTMLATPEHSGKAAHPASKR